MQTENRTKTPAKWLAVACLLLLPGVAVWFLRRPRSATVVQPERVSITETIAQLSGTLEHLFVKLGDRVKSGQVVLADEATGNLDSRSGDEVFKIMRSKKGNRFYHGYPRRSPRPEADRILPIDDGWVQEVDKRAPHETRE